LGVLIARVSGQSLGSFLRERIFEPLGMKDSGFFVPEAKLDRLPTCYGTDLLTGQLGVLDEARGGQVARAPVFEAGRFGWDGAFGTSWYVDPKEEMVGILMTQRRPDSLAIPAVTLDFWTSAYQLIDD
jgi:CubicO group peptidase (beta-lactamase class C family)